MHPHTIHDFSISARAIAFPLAFLGVWVSTAMVASYSHIHPAHVALVADVEPVAEEQGGVAAEPLAAAAASTERAAVEAQSEAVTVASPCSGCRAAELAARLKVAEARIVELEAELATCQGAQAAALSPSIARWVGELVAIGGETPAPATLLTLARVLERYPVVLTIDEGVWLAERAKLWDWKAWGSTIDEVIIRHLGPERIARDVSPATLAELRDEWPEHFGG